MKKVLLFITCISFLVSCNSEDDLINDSTYINTTSPSEMDLKSSGDFFDASNLIPLYEYFTYSGGQVVDTYYSIEYRGPSFRDTQSGYIFTYQGILGKIGKSPLPYQGYFDRVVYGLQLYYNPNYKTHKVLLSSNVNKTQPDYYEGWQYYFACDLGYIVRDYTQEDFNTKILTGKWKWLVNYTHRTPEYFRCFPIIYRQELSEPWFNSNTLGIIVPN